VRVLLTENDNLTAYPLVVYTL